MWRQVAWTSAARVSSRNHSIHRWVDHILVPLILRQRHGCTAPARSGSLRAPARGDKIRRANKKPRGRAGRPVALVVVRFPWGSVLALRCGSPSAPLDVASGGRHPPAPSSRPNLGCRRYCPGHSRGQGRGGSTKLFAVVSFDRSRCGAPLRPAPFRAPRMRTPRGPSRTLKSLHRAVSISDVPTVALRHARVGLLVRPIRRPRSVVDALTLRPVGVTRMWS